MNPILPPPPSALNDALALVRLALNPKEAATYLEQLTAQSTAHEAARNANIGQAQALAEREQAVSVKEAQVKAREDALAERESQLGTRGAALGAQQNAIASAKQELEAAKAAHEQNVQSFAAGQAQANQSLDARTIALDQREKALATKEAANEARLARLKEFIA